ncbi:unnamed protein product [Lepidochelys kempii]
MVEVKLSAKVAQMGALSELQLYRCPATMEPMALAFLQERLRGLHVQFTDITKIPSWLYSLKNLHQLHLSSHLCSNVLALEVLWELQSLEILLLQTKLTKLPCSMHWAVLKKTSSPQQLERIPPLVWHVTGLQRLGLRSSGIRSLEEGTGFQHLAQLTGLKLRHNCIATLSASTGAAGSLEELVLSHNELESLPHAFFTLKRLRHLDLSHNLLRLLPAEIGQLGTLQHLSITGNRIRALPSQLFACLELTSLQLADNALTTVPAEIGRLVLISRLELTGNPSESLPLKLGCCSLLKQTGLSVDNILFETLPSHVNQVLATPVSALSPERPLAAPETSLGGGQLGSLLCGWSVAPGHREEILVSSSKWTEPRHWVSGDLAGHGAPLSRWLHLYQVQHLLHHNHRAKSSPHPSRATLAHAPCSQRGLGAAESGVATEGGQPRLGGWALPAQPSWMVSPWTTGLRRRVREATAAGRSAALWIHSLLHLQNQEICCGGATGPPYGLEEERHLPQNTQCFPPGYEAARRI